MERPYIFNRDGKRVIIPKVSSIPATREWLANIMTYCQANGIITLSEFMESVDAMIDKQIEIEVDKWLEEKVFGEVEVETVNY